MRKEGMTVREATEEWVREFNAIQQGIIEKLVQADIEKWYEVTKPAAGNQVYIYDLPENSTEHYGEILSYDRESELYTIRLADDELVSAKAEDFEVVHNGWLPIWETMWSFDDSCDDWWLEEGNGIQMMSECGFRVYKSEEFGYFFGIDGAGYDFYEEHWVPLYRVRGLQWHDPATEKEVS